MIKKFLVLLFCLILIDVAIGATVHGTVYSFDLEEKDAIVSVDSNPEQQMVAKNGEYSFELGVGEYTINAVLVNGEKEEVNERIKIEKEGTFIFDLITFPSFEDEEELLKDVDEEVIDEKVLSEGVLMIDIVMFIVAIIGFILLGRFVYKHNKTLKKVTAEIVKNNMADELTHEVFEFIKKEGGRTTQKEIRNKFPSSEAKISLVISELVSKNMIEKIKKGRGNIIKIK